jgi:hypothetical protein
MANHVAFIRAGIERVYPGKWSPVGGDFGTAIEAGDQGVLVIHPPDGRFIHFAGGVLTGLTFSEGLVRYVSDQTRQAAFGAMTLSEGEPGYWMLAYGFKFAASWFDPSSPSAPQLVMDMLAFVPEYVGMQLQEIQPQFGGEGWGVPASWWYALMDRY